MAVSFPSRLLLIIFAAALRVAFGNVLLVAYEETEQDMLSLFEDNLGRHLVKLYCNNHS